MSSVTARKGQLWLLKYGTGSPLTYATVTGLRALTTKIVAGAVDITNKGSGGWQELLTGAGVQSMDITASGVFDAAGTQLKALQAAAVAGTLVPLQVIDSTAGDAFTGMFSVDFERAGPYNTEQTFTLTIKSSGVITYTPGS